VPSHNVSGSKRTPTRIGQSHRATG
jgi:hypothetical protein